MEEMTGIGQIQVQSLLDQEMAEMSPIQKMSYIQSRMHLDESVESNADSDLEDGEIRKLPTSSLYDRKASGRPDAKDIQGKWGKCTNVSFIRRSVSYPGNRLHCFSLRRNEERDQMWSSVFNGTLLAGSKDLLLHQARSDLAREEIHVESLNKCIGDSQKRTEV